MTPQNLLPASSTKYKGAVVCNIKREDDFWQYDIVKRYHPFRTNCNIQRWHHRISSTIHRTQDVGDFQGIFPPSTLRLTANGCYHKERGIHHRGAEHLRCTTSPTRILSWGNRFIAGNHTRNAKPMVWDGGTGRGKCSPDQFQLCSDGTIGATCYSYSLNAGPTKCPLFIINNKKKQRN